MNLIIGIVKGILNIIYAVIKIFPVQNKVTIVSRQGNSPSMDISMIEEEIKKQSPNTKVVVLCRKIGPGLKGKISYCFHFLRQMWHLGTAKAIITDSYCIGISILKQRKNVKIIQMWHALGAFKKFGLTIAGTGGEGRSEAVAKAMNMHEHYTHVLISAEACREPYKDAFGYTDEYIKVMSLPRVDAILDQNRKNKTAEAIYNDYPEFKNKKIVVYAPTFRKDRDFTEKISELGKSLKTDNEDYILVVKKHPLMEIKGEIPNTVIDNKYSTLEMLYIADYVICDYSAIVFEAALMGKPLFFYTFDLNEYEDRRNFYLDYEKDMPGVISETAEGIGKAIKENNYNLDRVKDFADKYIANKEGCTEKLVKFVLS